MLLTQIRKKTFPGIIFSQVSMHVAFLPLSILGTVNFVTIGSCIILIQVVVGSNMARHMKLILVLTFKSALTYEVYT